MDKDETTKNLIKTKIAEQIGVEVEDINDDDNFAEDLHMSPAEFSDFLSSLSFLGVDAHSLGISSSATVEELFETVSAQMVD